MLAIKFSQHMFTHDTEYIYDLTFRIKIKICEINRIADYAYSSLIKAYDENIIKRKNISLSTRENVFGESYEDIKKYNNYIDC